jgi:hypothetical protein
MKCEVAIQTLACLQAVDLVARGFTSPLRYENAALRGEKALRAPEVNSGGLKSAACDDPGIGCVGPAGPESGDTDLPSYQHNANTFQSTLLPD